MPQTLPAILLEPAADWLDEDALLAGFCARQAELDRALALVRARPLVRLSGAEGSGRTALLRAVGARLRREGWAVVGPLHGAGWAGWAALAAEVGRARGPGVRVLALVEDLDALPGGEPPTGLRVVGTRRVPAELHLDPLGDAEVERLLTRALGARPPAVATALARRVCGGQLRALAGWAAGLAQGGGPVQGLEAALRGAVRAGAARRRAALEALPGTERVALEALLAAWAPLDSAAVAERAGLEANLCSAALSRLVDRGLVVSGPLPSRPGAGPSLSSGARGGRRRWYSPRDALAVEPALLRSDPRLGAALRLAQARVARSLPTFPAPGVEGALPTLDPPWPTPRERLTRLAERALERARAPAPPAEPLCTGSEDPLARLLLREPPSPGWVHRALAVCREEAGLSPALHLALAEQALRQAPGEWKAERARARALQRLGHPGALAALRRALDANPKKLGGWERLVDALLHAGAVDEALALALQGLRRHADEARMQRLLGRALLAAGRPTEAARVLERAPTGEDPAAAGLLGLALALAGAPGAAPHLALGGPAERVLGALLLAVDDPAAARPALAALAPDPLAAQGLGWASLALGLPAAALEAVAGLPPDGELRWLRALALDALPAPGPVRERAWRELAEGGEPLAWAGLARSLEAQPGRRPDAELAWRRALAEEEPVWALAGLAGLLAASDPAESARLTARALVLHPGAPALLALQAAGLAAQGWHLEAEAAWRQALALDPEGDPARRGLAALLARRGQLEEAAAVLGSAGGPWTSALRCAVALARRAPEAEERLAEARATLEGAPAVALAWAWWRSDPAPPAPGLEAWARALHEDAPREASPRRLLAAVRAAQGAVPGALALLAPELGAPPTDLEALVELLCALDPLAASLGPRALAERLEAAPASTPLGAFALALHAQAGEPPLAPPLLLRLLGAPEPEPSAPRGAS